VERYSIIIFIEKKVALYIIIEFIQTKSDVLRNAHGEIFANRAGPP